MRTYKIISADTHLEISPEQWTWRLPAKYRDRGPRVVPLRPQDLPPGLPVFGEGWIAEGIDKVVPLGMNLAAGKKPDERRTYGWYYRENHIGAGDAAQRVREMDQDGVDAEVEYAAVAGPGFLGRIKDRDLYLACIEAYNDYLGKDYCAHAPDRLWGLAQVPMTGIEDAVAELKRTRGYKGIKGWQLGAWPSGKGYPSETDDTFWSLALQLKAPVTAHVTFSQDAAGEPKRSGQILEGTGALLHAVMSGGCPRPAYTVCQMMVHGVFDRFPDLRILFAETGALGAVLHGARGPDLPPVRPCQGCEAEQAPQRVLLPARTPGLPDGPLCHAEPPRHRSWELVLGQRFPALGGRLAGVPARY
jgi:predicted TIM-barrel fold metal-dependent hydrolase